jgi:beta-glucanase (GH16 family)
MEGGRLIHTGQPWLWYDSDAVYVDNVTSEILAYRELNTIHHWDGKTYNPTVACGLLPSADKFGYGRFSAKIQLPKGRNLWPAFWLIGDGKEDWPAVCEIDICEAWTNQFDGYYRCGTPQPPYVFPTWDTTTNVHWGKDKEHHESCGSRRLPIILSLKRPSHNYIKYEVEWRPNTITFFANGHCVRTYGWEVAQHLLGKKMRVIFDLGTTQAQFSCDSPMKIRNFEYKPIDVL